MPVATKKRSEKDSTALLRRALIAETPRAVAVLAALMNDEGQKPELRMKAAESILDRVCGKASAAQAAQGGECPSTITFEGVLEEWSR